MKINILMKVTRSGDHIMFGKNRSRLNESEKVNTMNISSIGYALLKKI